MQGARYTEAATFNRIAVDLFSPKEENKRHASAIVSISREKYLSC
jgi:hypothetical protein